jgi:hypothetical protein
MRARRAGALAALALCLGTAPMADAARLAVGLAPGADRAEVADRLRARGARGVVDLAPLPALAVSAPRAAALRGIRGTRYVEVLGSRRQAFVPNDPFLQRQWYATQNRAFDFWPEPPPLAPVRVAVIDSGVDGTHPELQGRIAASKSFVPGPATVDTQGHGTFVAGLIAAQTNDGIGIAGLAPPAELLVAKVVGPQRSIPVEAEAKAIRWAVANGARIINMSLGGLRDPSNPGRDTYSKLEADAVAFAVSKGVLVVAAVGNSDQAPSQPWPYASWPAALPHVIGVSALSRGGGSPGFSNRDSRFNDIAAPGDNILSTFPLTLTQDHPDCVEQGYSSCGPEEYRTAQGTSFATPQVSAAAAVLLATTPTLTPDQVTALLERSAVDADTATGCLVCATGRDRFTGTGRLDQAAALALLEAGIPPSDHYEPNDAGGADAYPLFGPRRQVDATLDYWDDRDDVFRVYLRAGNRLNVAEISEGARPVLALWRPGTESIDAASVRLRRLAVRPPGATLSYRAKAAGWYVLLASLSRPGTAAYRLTISKS